MIFFSCPFSFLEIDDEVAGNTFHFFFSFSMNGNQRCFWEYYFDTSFIVLVIIKQTNKQNNDLKFIFFFNVKPKVIFNFYKTLSTHILHNLKSEAPSSQRRLSHQILWSSFAYSPQLAMHLTSSSNLRLGFGFEWRRNCPSLFVDEREGEEYSMEESHRFLF